jgi:hypothetical protein
MKLLTIYTDKTKIFKDEWFLKTLRDDWELDIRYLEEIKEGDGDFRSSEWYYSIRKKIEYIIDEIKKSPGEIIIWADIDIQFFTKCSKIIEKAMRDKDVVFQAWNIKKREVCGGFIAIRCNDRTRSFFETVLKTDFNDLVFADQDVFNKILKQGSASIRWAIFPKQIYSVILGNAPLNIALHHACATKEPYIENGKKVGSIELKIEQLKKVRRFAEFPLIWKILYNLKRSIRL